MSDNRADVTQWEGDPDNPLVQGDVALQEARAQLDRGYRLMEHQRLLNGSLSAAERQAIEEWFTAQGLSLEPLRFTGRLLNYDGNGYVHADDLLGALPPTEVEKGKLLSQALGSTPVYARQVDDHTEFWRPDLRKYYIVVADDAPNFVITLLKAAVSSVTTISSGDCLDPINTFEVIRQSNYDDFDEFTRLLTFRIDVVYDNLTTACGDNADALTLACAFLPRFRQVVLSIVPFSTQNRMSFGPTMGIVDTAITADTTANRGTIVHELLHLMGLVHPQSEDVDLDPADGLPALNTSKIAVHGTEGGTSHLSVMYASTGDPNYRETLQPDDNKTVLTLYSNYQDGLACGYANNFRVPPFRL